jgi:hypothetical protein
MLSFVRTFAHPRNTHSPALSRVRVEWESVLLDPETYTRAVRPEPSPAELLPGWAPGVSEVSRFSCMKFLGVPGVFDYAGLIRDSRYRPRPCCLPRIFTASASGL